MATTFSLIFFWKKTANHILFCFNCNFFSYHISFANNVQAGYGNPRKIYFKNLFEH